MKAAFAQNKEMSMVTMDVQGAFDVVLRRRLLQQMMQQVCIIKMRFQVLPQQLCQIQKKQY
ncbi:predicted protein [Histoplasma mississippiense (nom. inval.)]|uniref:predicted protein n=1 Tax=Ajellomyces capsulatus (strain NAm1 / WU24) TaxID=2059318 RepID=UPI000157D2F0|nr:predicted protein [Histoplasma mississippiense (nom. inval.)]EDN04761.1 predicted protein [Histoplasma mississippiense (nom. inval.)]